MNERIRELHSKVLDESGNMRWNIEDAEKFAELIVRECIEYCGENLSKTVAAALKIHFGVKE